MHDSAEAVVEAFVRAINRQDVDDLASLMTEEHKFIDSLGNPMVGREKMRAAWESYFKMVPDYTITVDETLSDGPVVVMLGTAQGTYRDPAKAGSALLERENRWSTPAVFRAFIEDGKVTEWRVYADNEPIRKLIGNRE
jgi:uncharacterized protein (TIGR02246 family)